MLVLHDSDLTLRLGSLAILCIYSAVILLLSGILLLRFIRLAKERRRRNVTAIWRPLLAQCVVEVPETWVVHTFVIGSSPINAPLVPFSSWKTSS